MESLPFQHTARSKPLLTSTSAPVKEDVDIVDPLELGSLRSARPRNAETERIALVETGEARVHIMVVWPGGYELTETFFKESVMRRYNGNMNGERYLGNTNTTEVHDLDNEQTNCQIDEIIKAGHDTPFNTLSAAHAAGYDNCAYCIGGSTR